MSTFCFKNPKTGEVYEEVYTSHKEVPKSIKFNGVVCKRDLISELRGQTKNPSGGYPMKSYALAVPAWRAKEFTERSERLGVPTKHDEMGRPEFRSAGHKKKYAELRGATDFDGGHGGANSEGKEVALTV